MILKTYEIGSDLKTNNYLLFDEISHEALLIDCTGEYERINKDIRSLGANLKYILLTHAHFDHITGCDEFLKKTNAKLLMSRNDTYLLDNIKTQCEMFGIPIFEKPEVAQFIDEKTDLKIGNHKIKILETKGHSKGGLSFIIDNMLFSGDTLFYEEIGRCDLPGGSFDEIKESITKKLFALSPLTKVYPGHGLATTIEHEIEFNCYFGKNSRFL